MSALPDPDFWRKQRVLLTGHTGFKGGWAALWLASMGAEVTGYALPPATTPSLFTAIDLPNLIQSEIGDIRDFARLEEVVDRTQPTVIIHMAAQPLVRLSYAMPLETYSTNVMGTAHVLELARSRQHIRATLVITTDKCYENLEQSIAYKEDDRLGGRDPYSSSKACAELVAQAYWWSYFSGSQEQSIGTVRAGNVIGGGDWSKDRLIPDLIAAFEKGNEAILRRPESVRPWQHVLDPVSGYLVAIEKLCGPRQSQAPMAWNFGPEPGDNLPVSDVTRIFAQAWGHGARYRIEREPNAVHEATLLMLDATKAKKELGWSPRWRLAEALNQTAEWHKQYNARADMRSFTKSQLANFTNTRTQVDHT